MDKTNSFARFRSAKYRSKILELKEKANDTAADNHDNDNDKKHGKDKEEEQQHCQPLTQSETLVLLEFETARTRKNLKTQARELDKRRLVKAIVSKPTKERTVEEIRFLDELDAKKRLKSKNDSLRRAKQKKLLFLPHD
jgi:hypothetical protein